MNNPTANSTTRTDIRAERGQTMAEYGVLIALITVAVAGAFTLLNGAIVDMFGRVAGYVGG
jgi:Flp pilus assembly pilin Flp